MATKKAATKKAAKVKPAIVRRPYPQGITKLLGLDLSQNSTGWALCDVSTNTVTWGTLENGKKVTDKLLGMERLDWIADGVIKLLSGGRVDKTLVFIENFAFGAANKAHDIGMVHGVVRHMLHRAGIKTVMVSPLSVKKWVTGMSTSKKELMIKYIEKNYGYDCDQNDAADALGLVTLGRAYIGRHPKQLVGYQNEVLDKMLAL